MNKPPDKAEISHAVKKYPKYFKWLKDLMRNVENNDLGGIKPTRREMWSLFAASGLPIDSVNRHFSS